CPLIPMVAGAGEKRSTFEAWYIDARPVHHLPSRHSSCNARPDHTCGLVQPVRIAVFQAASLDCALPVGGPVGSRDAVRCASDCALPWCVRLAAPADTFADAHGFLRPPARVIE